MKVKVVNLDGEPIEMHWKRLPVGGVLVVAPKLDALTADVRESTRADVVHALRELAAQLEGHGLRINQFRKRMRTARGQN